MLMAIATILPVLQLSSQTGFKTIAEAVQALPSMPQVEQVLTSEAQNEVNAAICAPYRQALQITNEELREESKLIDERLDKIRELQAAGTLPQSPNDKRLSDIYATLLSLFQQISKENVAYHNIVAVAEDYGKLNEQTTENEANDILRGSTMNGYDMRMLQKQLHNEWIASEDYATIKAIEADLQERVKQWRDSLKALGKKKCPKELPDPAWWTEGREKENVLIERWNRASAARWISTATASQEKFKSCFLQAIPLEAEIRQMDEQACQDDLMYWTCRHSLLMIHEQAEVLGFPLQDAVAFPYLIKVTTTGTVKIRLTIADGL